jgi:hypothetical protein
VSFICTKNTLSSLKIILPLAALFSTLKAVVADVVPNPLIDTLCVNGLTKDAVLAKEALSIKPDPEKEPVIPWVTVSEPEIIELSLDISPFLAMNSFAMILSRPYRRSVINILESKPCFCGVVVL